MTYTSAIENMNRGANPAQLGSFHRWQRIEEVLDSNYFKPDLQAVRAFYAAIAAHTLTGQPVWPMLVGPPGSMKTELLMGLGENGAGSLRGPNHRTDLHQRPDC